MKQVFAILILSFSSLTFAGQQAEQQVDNQCQIAGCSSEICTNQAPKEDDGIISTCEYKNYYECFRISNCVINKTSNMCGWQRNPRFLSCLKEKKAPNSVIQRYAGRSIMQFVIKLADRG